MITIAGEALVDMVINPNINHSNEFTALPGGSAFNSLALLAY